ncbi:MAG: hypothetical protein ABI822_06665 [Bryobacteraceae bacterium]
MEEAEDRRKAFAGRELAAHEKELLRDLRVLQLSRTRILQQISDATREGYRIMLQQALADQDQKIAALEEQVNLPTG